MRNSAGIALRASLISTLWILSSCTSAGRCEIGVQGCICTAESTCSDGSSCVGGMCVGGAMGFDGGQRDGTVDTDSGGDGGEDQDASDGATAQCNEECDDGLACTMDVCGPDGACMHIPQDIDGDGFVALGCLDGDDCDDNNEDVHPEGTEVCDGADNDCDGTIDNGFDCVAGSDGVSCTTDCGTTGTQTCDSSCSLSECVAEEECNGCDDNGDGEEDETFECAQGESESCMVGMCSGTRACSNACGFEQCDLGTAPANNTCGAGVVTISNSGSYSFETCAGTDNYTSTCGGGAAPEVVFRLQVTGLSDVMLETQANFDTILHLRDGPACPGTENTCDDDSGPGTTSLISTRLGTGTYYVVVDGKNADDIGSGSLRVSIDPVIADECGDAIPIVLEPGRTVVNGSTTGATSSPDACSGGPDVWYSFELEQAEVVWIHTFGSTYDTALGLNTVCGTSLPIDCNDDADFCTGENLQSELLFALDPGTYFVAVDGFDTNSGDFTLTIDHLPLGNTLTALALPAGMTTQMGTTSGVGLLEDCPFFGLEAPEETFFWTQCPGDPGGPFEIDTRDPGTDFDTIVYVWSAGAGGTLACNDDADSTMVGPSLVTADIPAGAGLFTAYIDGYNTSAGNYVAHFLRP